MRKSLKLAYTDEGCLLLKPHLPLAKPRALNQARPPLRHVPTALLVPLVVPECSGLLSFSRAEPGSRCWPQPRKKDCQVGGNRRVFCFFSAGESKVIFGPFQYKSDFFFSFRKALCLAGFGQESANQSSRSEYLCIFAGCQFCLPSWAWLSPVSPDC